MADYLQKFTLVAGVPQTIDAGESIIGFDWTNDSPFDVDVQWGSNKPVALTVPPTTIWRGTKPSSDLLISGNKRSGSIVITPSYPAGGSQPGGAPAAQLTVHGYVKGNEPGELITPLNRLASIGNHIGTGQTYNAILECFPILAMNAVFGTVTVVPLTNQRLNLAGVSPLTPGYLLLDYLKVRAGAEVFRNIQGRLESFIQSQNWTLPASTNNNVQQFLFNNVGNLTAIGIFGLNSNTTVNNIEIKHSADPVGSYVSILPASTTTSQIIDLTKIFGKDGFTNTNLSNSAGISIRITGSNAFSGQATLTLVFYGSQYDYDEAQFAVSYVDWQNNVYDIGDFRHGQRELLPLDMLVPIPITDPAQTNFGSLQFELVFSLLSYDTTSSIYAFIPAAISFLAPV